MSADRRKAKNKRLDKIWKAVNVTKVKNQIRENDSNGLPSTTASFLTSFSRADYHSGQAWVWRQAVLNHIDNVSISPKVSIKNEKIKDMRVAFLKFLMIPQVEDILNDLPDEASKDDAKRNYETWMQVAYKTTTFTRDSKKTAEINQSKLGDLKFKMMKIMKLSDDFLKKMFSSKTIALLLTDPYLVRDSPFLDEMLYLCEKANDKYYDHPTKIELEANDIEGFI